MSINIKEFGKLEEYIPRDTKKKSVEEKKRRSKKYNKKYNAEHKEEIIAYGKKYYGKNEEKKRKYSKAYKVKILILGSFGEEGFSVQLRQEVNVTGKTIGVGHFAGPRTPEQNSLATRKRKLKNVEVLNKRFEGSELHHLTKDVAVHIPKELHQSVWHNLETGEGMDEINGKALVWIGKQITE